MKKLTTLFILIVVALASCSTIDEPQTKVNYVLYQYRNNIGQVATNQITSVTEFAFDSKGVLGQINKGILNGKIAKRPITVPDGQWTVLSFGNLTGDNEIIDITNNAAVVVGKTKMSDMVVRLKRKAPDNLLTYADEDLPTVGYSDRLYFGKVALNVNKGNVNKIHLVEMSNAHIWLTATLVFEDKTQIPEDTKNLHARLEHVPYEYSMLSDDKQDNFYRINYSTPRITGNLATLLTTLTPTADKPGQLKFDIYGMRWDIGKAPILSFWDGEKPLILNKETGSVKGMDLNTYFSDQAINLSTTRVQFFNIAMKVAPDGTVSVSNLEIGPWEDGGTSEW